MFNVQAARQLQLPTFMAGGVWHTVIVSPPFIWDAAHPVPSVIYCYCTSVLGRFAGELAACLCWQSTARINCPGQSGATKYDVMVVKSNSLSVAPTLQAALSKQDNKSERKCPLCRYICRADVLLSLRQRSQYKLWKAEKCGGGPWSAKWLIRHKTDSMWSLDSTRLMWLLDSSLFSAAFRQQDPVQLIDPDTQPWTLLPSNPLRVLSHIQMSSWGNDRALLSCGGVSNTHACAVHSLRKS